MNRPFLFAILLLLAGCPVEEGDAEPCGFEEEGAVHAEQAGVPGVVGPDDRLAEVRVPFAYDGRTALPVVFLLHGYGANASLQDFLFKFGDRVDQDQFILVLPNGTQDSRGRPHWNATDACCDFDGSQTDDVAYLTGLLDELEATFRVDPDRVYFTGHSNGGYMSYRMACEIPDRIAGILPLAGATWLDDSLCGATEGVAILHVHGTEDPDVLYEGGSDYPSAMDSVATWAARGGCDTAAASQGESLDLVNHLEGAETTVTNWTEGCGCGLTSTLWTMEGEGHVPPFTEAFAESALTWLLERRKFR
jgi:polyhydroxybutyrate depolymerase